MARHSAADRMQAEDIAYAKAQTAERDARFEEFNRAEYEAEWGFAYEGHHTYRIS